MREILFKAKRLDDNEWVYGYLVKHPSAIQIGETSPWFIHVPPEHPEDNGGIHNVNEKTICQYTGLTDSKNQKVFEGDIIEFDDTYSGINFIGHIEFGNPNGKYDWGFQIVHDSGDAPRNDILLWFDMEEAGAYSEIIGNIHDSKPEPTN